LVLQFRSQYFKLWLEASEMLRLNQGEEPWGATLKYVKQDWCVMSGVNYQCATCGNKYVSKNKLKKHQKRQNPRHTGFIQVFSSLNDQKNKTTTTNTTCKTMAEFCRLWFFEIHLSRNDQAQNAEWKI